ncbi:MAG: hypothetical protein Q4C55_05045 [Eubacterium sp.]|nr:hypothetical protein [Eubacterium sp.]
MTKAGKIFMFLGIASLFYGLGLGCYGFTAQHLTTDYGDFLFLYYLIQASMVVVMLGVSIFQDLFSDKDIPRVLYIAFINITIYSVIALWTGFFFTYVEDMLDVIIYLLNGTFIVGVIFWYKGMMG